MTVFLTFITSVDINVNYYITLTFVTPMMKTGERDWGGIKRQINTDIRRRPKTSHRSSLATTFRGDRAHLGLIRWRNIKLMKLLVLMVDGV